MVPEAFSNTASNGRKFHLAIEAVMDHDFNNLEPWARNTMSFLTSLYECLTVSEDPSDTRGAVCPIVDLSAPHSCISCSTQARSVSGGDNAKQILVHRSIPAHIRMRQAIIFAFLSLAASSNPNADSIGTWGLFGVRLCVGHRHNPMPDLHLCCMPGRRNPHFHPPRPNCLPTVRLRQANHYWGTTTKPTSVTLTTTTSCPTFSCASCPAGQTQTQTRSAPGACLQCACAKPTSTTTKPTSTTISTTTAACPTFSCASCPLGQTQTQTPGANGCLQCGCATPAALGTLTVPPATQTGTSTTAIAESTTTADTDTTSDSANSGNGGVLGGNGASSNQRAATSLLGAGSILAFFLAFL
ncbi:hypothetical protein FA13DRAFT_1771335 [Coprinellus micaceus]|uniref:Uncharacterized protein n=1 Tax=Coprinellus micaceus TaxID=71717 RepID=A0A4Y7TSL6_COPMI|nr:hypothetical protein FA13DRAFT_1771335 [Coprinellus micaceus]